MSEKIHTCEFVYTRMVSFVVVLCKSVCACVPACVRVCVSVTARACVFAFV